ncbi:unnamed protein product [Allacma fusca]|uniref:Cytochrome P450 n=1 Tax=Allacma fusca TaxID=39272 RepID=A0A8J2NRX2_9HEXA|nr:unnamed protein product [Allacma fusca]
MILEILIALILTIVLGVILYGRWNYGILESMGVPVVKPSLFLGSIPDLHKKVIHEQDIEFFKKYGPIYGVYEGREPFLYICDADLVKQVQVAEFDHFRDRRRIDLGDAYFNEMMDFLEYEKWKVIRHQLMPALSPAKYKRQKQSLDECLDRFVANLSKLCGSTKRANIDLRKEAITFNVDFTAIHLYGTNVSNPEDENNFLRKGASEIMGEAEEFNFLYPLSMSFPILTKLAPSLKSDSIDKWKELITFLMTERKKSKDPPVGDFLDSLIMLLNKVDTPEFKSLKITDVTVYAQAIVIFLGGYDTFATAIVFLAYFLAKAPKIQLKLLQEVDAYFTKHETVEYETTSELPFMSACIMETLRLIPAFRISERINPDNFDDPEEFKPERFLPENMGNMKPYASAIFGNGPRNCAGQRFAVDFLKIVAARLFKDFRFEISPDTEIKFKTGRMFMVQYHPIYFDLIKRH